MRPKDNANAKYTIDITEICMATMLGKSSKHIFPNGSFFMVNHHGRIRKKNNLKQTKK